MTVTAAQLLATHADAVAAEGRPLFIAIDIAGEQFCAFEPFDGVLHPLIEAAAVVATGRIRRLDDHQEILGRCRLACVIDRTGEVDWLMTTDWPDATPEVLTTPPAEGAMLALLRGALEVAS